MHRIWVYLSVGDEGREGRVASQSSPSLVRTSCYSLGGVYFPCDPLIRRFVYLPLIQPTRLRRLGPTGLKDV